MLSINEHILKYTILAFLWLEYAWELYLSIRQYRIVVASSQVPPELKNTMTQEIFDKAKKYTLARMKFGFVKDTFAIILSTIVVSFNILSLFWDHSLSITKGGGEIYTSCVWLLILSTLQTIIELPLTVYNTFVLEEKFGFNKQTCGFFVWDKVKAFILTQVMVLMISSVIIVTIKNGGEYFFVWLWLVVCIISLLLLTIYPSVIAPIFDKYTLLPEGDLRTEIEKLASQLSFPLAQLYVVEGSKRSSHSNAYFYGFFKSKRIVLFDTLLATNEGTGCKNDEILAVLSHELGHWKHSHLIKNIVIMQVNLFLLFTGFGFMFNYPPIYKALGFYNSQPVLVGLIVVLQYVMMPYNTLLSFLMTCLSRKFEFQADNFACKLDMSRPLISALIQLNRDNLGFPIYDNLYSVWHHSHPPLLERIEVIRQFGLKQE